jgi:hypothetical protein
VALLARSSLDKRSYADRHVRIDVSRRLGTDPVTTFLRCPELAAVPFAAPISTYLRFEVISPMLLCAEADKQGAKTPKTLALPHNRRSRLRADQRDPKPADAESHGRLRPIAGLPASRLRPSDHPQTQTPTRPSPYIRVSPPNDANRRGMPNTATPNTCKSLPESERLSSGPFARIRACSPVFASSGRQDHIRVGAGDPRSRGRFRGRRGGQTPATSSEAPA